ncbi:hypothetical protein AMS68_002010 [Peltaster fructicola]|uniref:Xylanolytic transcriptional activator regulatory domain-containing protein n=1 Tax=Peltaster fructicola TaxID=286661 RepID=A0A6H0XP50_9PEZI|nr:hypothetical protein AMS68_002010 [Peltaster fructicola]
MCVKFEYKCYFEKHSRKRSKIVEKDAAENGFTTPAQYNDFGSTGVAKPGLDPKPERAAPEEISKLRSMEANSGIAFTRLLGMRLDATAGPKLFTFGWNLGATPRSLTQIPSITTYLDLNQLLTMARVYFEHVHPLYGFLDKDWVMSQIMVRFTKTEQLQYCPDHIFAGIAVLGAQFAPGVIDSVVPALVEAAKLSLESTSTCQPPTLSDVQAWLLRVIYLRCSGHPHSCWIASNLTMHLIECMGLHQELSASIIYALPQEPKDDPELRRRSFWIGRMFNTWVSFEYGRSRVALRGITCHLPERREGDFTREYISLYSISCCLDPELLDKPGQWEDFLHQLESFEARHECMQLSKANLGLCAYRRLRLANPNLPSDIINRIINLARAGLQAAKTLASRSMPWWHVANVPFQSICVFLAIDSKESLSHIAPAMRTLEYVAERFPSPSIREALKNARSLIKLSKRKKDEDSEVLSHSLLTEVSNHGQRAPRPAQPAPLTTYVGPMQEHDGSPPTASSSEEWNLDYLNNSDFDWNVFLGQDIPAFHNLAPDGMM